MIAALLLSLLLLASAGCTPGDGGSGATGAPTKNATSQAGGTTDDSSPPNGKTPGLPVTGEVLLADPPRGWVESGTLTSPLLRMAEYVPADQADRETPGAPDQGPQTSADTAGQTARAPLPEALDRVTFEAQAGDSLPDPIEFVLALGRDLAQRCEGFTEFNIMSGSENNYATSVRLLVCPRYRDRSRGEVMMVKAIQGREYFYTITRGRRLPAFAPDTPALEASTMAEWSAYLRAIGVCDPRSPEHACPEGITTGSKTP